MELSRSEKEDNRFESKKKKAEIPSTLLSLAYSVIGNRPSKSH